MAQIKNLQAIRALQNEAKVIESKMKALETRRKTGRLNNSISFIYDPRKGAFIFNAVYYGSFQDMGTYRQKNETPTGRAVWGKYKPKGRGRQGTGIKPLHFTEPMAQFGKKEIVSIVKPFILKEMKQKALKLIKDTNVSSITKT